MYVLPIPYIHSLFCKDSVYIPVYACIENQPVAYTHSLFDRSMYIYLVYIYLSGFNNGIGWFHKNLVTFWGPKLPDF